MGSRILYELSQEVSLLLENSLRGDGSRPTPVFFCHPLDSLEDQQDPARGTFGILYMTRILPDLNMRQNGIDVSSVLDDHLHPRLSRPPLWVRVRYVFLVAGGDVEEQLVALASVLQTLHDRQCVRIPDRRDTDHDPEGGTGTEDDPMPGNGAVICPLRLVEDDEGWRELGLDEHRLMLTFEVTCPIPALTTETVDRIQERVLRIEESAP